MESPVITIECHILTQLKKNDSMSYRKSKRDKICPVISLPLSAGVTVCVSRALPSVSCLLRHLPRNSLRIRAFWFEAFSRELLNYMNEHDCHDSQEDFWLIGKWPVGALPERGQIFADFFSVVIGF